MSGSFDINEDAQSGGEYSGSQSSVNDSQPIESAFPDEDEETITMLDVIEREDKLEEEASAVLGNSDEKNCTYPKGYISRQALYSCATCFDASDAQAAICLACSLECHDNHDVYELYTKRNYRCDCGNSKFKAGFECKLMDKGQKKLPLNENNKYNHNFFGKYCTCDKRYPPEEHDDDTNEDEMWQCIVCEDWYHSKHLGAKELPAKFDEMICGQCADELVFVHYYKNLNESENEDLKNTIQTDVEESKLDIEATIQDGDTERTGADSERSSHQGSQECSATFDSIKSSGSNAVCESDTNDSQLENKDPVKPQPTVECLLDNLKKMHEFAAPSQASDSSKSLILLKGPVFWKDCSWRSKLCRCQKCIDMYKIKNCEYLLDDKDTVQYYEAQGKAIAKKSETPFERGMSALKGMNRVAVAEALHGYDELKANLSDYLRKFADTKKVVREEDIHEFFHQLRSKKRPRLD